MSVLPPLRTPSYWSSSLFFPLFLIGSGGRLFDVRAKGSPPLPMPLRDRSLGKEHADFPSSRLKPFLIIFLIGGEMFPVVIFLLKAHPSLPPPLLRAPFPFRSGRRPFFPPCGHRPLFLDRPPPPVAFPLPPLLRFFFFPNAAMRFFLFSFNGTSTGPPFSRHRAGGRPRNHLHPFSPRKSPSPLLFVEWR